MKEKEAATVVAEAAPQKCDHPFGFIHGHGNWPKELFIGTPRRAALTFDEAWAELRTVLPARGWWVVGIEHNSEDEPPAWRAVELSGTPHVYAEWADTPAAATANLTARLRAEGTEPAGSATILDPEATRTEEGK